MNGLTITKSVLDGGWMSLAVTGEIDLATVDELRDAINRVAETGSHLVVDLRGAEFMDSTGLKTLVVANRSFGEASRSFALAVQAGPIWRLIDLSGIESSINIVEDPKDLIENAPEPV